MYKPKEAIPIETTILNNGINYFYAISPENQE